MLACPASWKPNWRSGQAWTPRRLARPVERLAAILHAAEPALRHAAAIELSKMGRDAELALPALKATCDDPDEEVREASRTALTRIQPPQ